MRLCVHCMRYPLREKRGHAALLLAPLALLLLNDQVVFAKDHGGRKGAAEDAPEQEHVRRPGLREHATAKLYDDRRFLPPPAKRTAARRIPGSCGGRNGARMSRAALGPSGPAAPPMRPQRDRNMIARGWDCKIPWQAQMTSANLHRCSLQCRRRPPRHIARP